MAGGAEVKKITCGKHLMLILICVEEHQKHVRSTAKQLFLTAVQLFCFWIQLSFYDRRQGVMGGREINSTITKINSGRSMRSMSQNVIYIQVLELLFVILSDQS